MNICLCPLTLTLRVLHESHATAALGPRFLFIDVIPGPERELGLPTGGAIPASSSGINRAVLRPEFPARVSEDGLQPGTIVGNSTRTGGVGNTP